MMQILRTFQTHMAYFFLFAYDNASNFKTRSFLFKLLNKFDILFRSGKSTHKFMSTGQLD